MASITITITDLANYGMQVTTDADRPVIGRGVTPAEALAMELLGTSFKNGATVIYDAGQVPLVSLALDLISPEGYGHDIPLEVRRRAKEVLGPRMAQLVRTPSPGVDIDAVHRSRQVKA